MSNMTINASCNPIFSLLLFLLLTTTFLATAKRTKATPVNVGMVVNSDTKSGKMLLSCISIAVSDFYASQSAYKTRLVLHKRKSPFDVVVTASAVIFIFFFFLMTWYSCSVSYFVPLIKSAYLLRLSMIRNFESCWIEFHFLRNLIY